MKLRVINTHEELLAAIADGVVLGDMHFTSTAQGRYVERARKEGFQAGKEESERQWAEERANLVNAAIDLNSTEIEGGVRAQERKRILGIQAITKRGLESVADEAIEQGVSEEEFALMMLREIHDRGITLDAISADAPPIAPLAPPPRDESYALKGPGVFAKSKAIYDQRAQQTEAARTRSR